MSDKSMNQHSITDQNVNITLISSDGVRLIVNKKAILLSKTIHDLLSDLGEKDEAIPINTISHEILIKIILFCEYAQQHQVNMFTLDNGVKENNKPSVWIQTFCDIDRDSKVEIIRAANYLNIPILIDVMISSIAKELYKLNLSDIEKLLQKYTL